MSMLRARACLAALATTVLASTALCTAVLAATPAGAAASAAPDIKQVACTKSTFAVSYDNGAKEACYSGTGSVSVALPKADGVLTGVNTGEFTLYHPGASDHVSFTPGLTLRIPPGWEMTSIDIVST